MASGWIARNSYTDKKTGRRVIGRNDIYRRDDYTCCYCGKKCNTYSMESMKANPHDLITLDHIVSQWQIAQTCESEAEFKREIRNPRNLVAVCNGCNSSKKKTDLYIWCQSKGFDYAIILERIADRIQREIA